MSQFKWNDVEIPNRGALTRKVGMGWNPNYADAGVSLSRDQKKKKLIGFIRDAVVTPTYNLPVLDNVTIHYDGPITDAQITAFFGNTINPLGSNKANPPPGSVQVDSTFFQPGEFQLWNLICGIQWRLDYEPYSATVLGNSWTAPAAATAGPVSPDDFNVNGGSGSANADDLTGAAGANSPLGLATGETMTQAALEWAWWSEMAGFYMSRGYNLQWQMGNRELLLNDSLRYTAFVPTNTQEGSASSSDVDVNFMVRRTNNYYRNNLTSPEIFLAADRSRLGNMTLGGVAGLSVFRPTRAYEFVGATFGGNVLKAFLKGNTEFRRLTSPILFAPGVPIGLQAVQSNTDDSNLMRAYLSATYNGVTGITPPGTIPANFTADANLNTGASRAGTAAVTGAEPSLDNPIAPRSQQLNANRKIYKGGTWKLTVAFKGFEFTSEQAALASDPDVQAAIAAECGCACRGK